MKEIATFKCQSNKSKITNVTFYEGEDHAYQLWFTTECNIAANDLNNKFISILRISDADEENKDNTLSFISEYRDNIVMLIGNLHHAFSVMKTYRMLDTQTINAIEDPDEIETNKILQQTQSIQIKDFYEQTIQKRNEQKTADKSQPLLDENIQLILQSEKNFIQDLTNLSPQERTVVIEKLNEDLGELGYELISSSKQEENSPTIVGPV